MSREELLSLRA
jgi:hypothetical protein